MTFAEKLSVWTLQNVNKILGTSYDTWKEVSAHPNLSEGFLDAIAEYLDWDIVFKNQHLSEEFTNKHKDRI